MQSNAKVHGYEVTNYARELVDALGNLKRRCLICDRFFQVDLAHGAGQARCPAHSR